MKKCPSCGEMNSDHNSKCSHCGELLLSAIPPKKHFPIGALMLLELLAFGVLVFTMYVFRAGGNPLITFVLAAALAVIAPFVCVSVYRKRKEKYTAYMAQVNAQQGDASLEEMQRALQERGESLPFLAYYTDLENVEKRMRRNSYASNGGEAITWEEFNNRFCMYITSCGIDIPRQDIIEFLTAMATSRLIHLCVVPSENTAYLFEIMKRFFGVDYHATRVQPEWKTTYDLLGQNTVEKGSTAATGVLLDMYCARYTDNRMCFTALEYVDPTQEKDYLYDILPYVRNPAKERNILFRKGANAVNLEFVQDQEFRLPQNMWYFCVPSMRSDLTIPSLRREKILAGFERTQSLCLHVNSAGPLRPEICAPLHHPIQYDWFVSMVSDVYEHTLLSEAQWRKWDAYKLFSRDKLTLPIRNRDDVMMENVTSLYMASSPDSVTEEMAMDFALQTYILPRVIREADASALQEGELEQAMDVIFGENAVPRFVQGLCAWKRMHGMTHLNETNQEGKE